MVLLSLRIIPVKYHLHLKLMLILECILKIAKSNERFYTEKYQDHNALVFLTSLFVLIINLVNQLLFMEMEMLLIDLLKQFLKSMNTEKTF